VYSPKNFFTVMCLFEVFILSLRLNDCIHSLHTHCFYLSVHFPMLTKYAFSKIKLLGVACLKTAFVGYACTVLMRLCVTEWYWKCCITPWSLRMATVLMAVLTLMVVWSECVFFIKTPVLSLFAVFLNLATTHSYNYIAIEVCLFFMSLLWSTLLCYSARVLT